MKKKTSDDDEFKALVKESVIYLAELHEKDEIDVNEFATSMAMLCCLITESHKVIMDKLKEFE